MMLLRAEKGTVIPFGEVHFEDMTFGRDPARGPWTIGIGGRGRKPPLKYYGGEKMARSKVLPLYLGRGGCREFI